MGNLDYKGFSERHRPHLHPPERTLFVTYRLADSIPQAVVREYKAKRDWLTGEVERVRRITQNKPSPDTEKWLEKVANFERQWFVKFDRLLHQAAVGPTWLKHDEVAKTVAENLHRLDGEAYRLDAYCVMSNHVHVVFKPFLSEHELQEGFDKSGRLIFTSDSPGLSRIMHSLKGRSARESNLLLARRGQFWEHESFDHVVRQGKLSRTVRYVLNNPIKAGIAKNWRDWRWSYCRAELASVMSDEL